MKINARDLGKVAQQWKHYAVVLLYAEQSNYLTLPLALLTKGKKYIRLSADPFLKGEKRFEDIFSMPDLFTLPQDYMLEDVPEKILKHLESYVATSFVPGKAGGLILTTSYLLPRSKLRQWAEKTPHVALVPCYEPKTQDVMPLLTKTLHDNGYTIAKEALQGLAHFLLAENRPFDTALDFLINYMGKQHAITLADVKACFWGQGVEGREEIFQALYVRDAEKLSRTLLHAGDWEAEAIPLFRKIFQDFLRVHTLLRLQSQGKTWDQAIQETRPPLNAFIAQEWKQWVHLWSLKEVEHVLRICSKAEEKTKEGETLAGLSHLLFECFQTKIQPTPYS